MATKIAKLQAQLQHVPDQALIDYVQNPKGEVPSYLALAELSRRKEIRKGAAPKQAVPTQTVAAQVAQPEPGVAALPIPQDMFEEKSMAAGGIVAFADGGSTGFRLSDPQWEGFNWAPTGSTKYNQNLQDLYQRAKVNTPWLTYDEFVRQVKSAPVAAPSDAEVINAATMPKRNITPINYDKVPAREVVKAPPLANTTIDQSRSTPAPTGIQRVAYQPGEDYTADYEKQIRPGETAQEAMAKYQGLLGTDVGREKLNERLAAMEAKAAKEEEQAPWMALARAGLGMAAGKSQFALQNIAAGGAEGLKDLAESKARLQASEEKRFAIQSQLAQADRAEKVAAATYGLNSEEATKAHNEKVRLAQLGAKQERATANAKGAFEADKANLSADVEVAKLGEDKRYHDLWYKANMEKANKDAAALEKSIRSNETTQLKTLMSEAGDRLDKLIASGVDQTDPLYVSSLQIYNGAANALGLKTGVKTTPAQTGPRSKPLSAFSK